MSDLPNWCCASGCKKCPAWREQEHKAEAKRERDRKYQRARRRSNRARGLCVECGVDEPKRGLVRCQDCNERWRLYARRWDRTPRGRRMTRVRKRLRYSASAELRERTRARMRERYQTLKDAGICIKCGQRDRGATLRCDECNSGKSRRDALLGRPPLPGRETTMRERLLRGMRFMDWTRSEQINNALAIDGADRNTAAQTLSRLVQYGLAERTGRNPFSYRLTAVGRAEADRIRNGGAVLSNRAVAP
jgi:hypothetical protein